MGTAHSSSYHNLALVKCSAFCLASKTNTFEYIVYLYAIVHSH